MRHLLMITVFGLTLPLAVVLVAQSVQAEDAPTADAAAIEALVAKLGADDFRTREQASKQLETLGAKARPALEQAAKQAESPEVRWRAQQILRRLKGTDQERQLGGSAAPRPPATPPTPDAPERPGFPKGFDNPFGPGGAIEGKDLDEAFKKVEEMLEKFGGERGRMGPLFGTRRLNAPGLVLERSITGRITLRVKREDAAAGAKVVEDIYTGHSLEDILANNPKLADHAGMAELKRREAEADWPGMPDLANPFRGFRVEPFSGGGFGMTMGSGVSVRQDASGATVTIREKDEDGKEVVKEYKGATIDEIKKKHPEIADKIGNFSIRVMPPRVFWPGARTDPLHPLAPTTPRGRPVGKAIFGLTLTDVSEALASHLALAKGRGALVANVMPGSQAEAMGVLRNDILLDVNGQAVGVSEAADLLRKAGTDKAPITLTLIRKGERKTLTR